VAVHIVIASSDGDLRLGLHVGLANAVPSAVVSTVSSPVELLASASSTQPAVVVIDLRAQARPGELLERIRRTASESSIVAISDEADIAALPDRHRVLIAPSGTAPRSLVGAIARVASAQAALGDP
jgi:DNA-binding NarL/FixJ family response regulator